MTKHYFEIDRKIIVWERNKYSVPANTFEEAFAKLQKDFEELNFEEDSGFISSEILHETTQPLSLSDNGEYATISIQDEHGNIIYQNSKQL